MENTPAKLYERWDIHQRPALVNDDKFLPC